MPKKSRSMAHPWLNGWKLRKKHLKCLDPNTSEGQVARWMWQGPGKVQLNVSCLEAWLVGDFERECVEPSYLLHMIVYDCLWLSLCRLSKEIWMRNFLWLFMPYCFRQLRYPIHSNTRSVIISYLILYVWPLEFPLPMLHGSDLLRS